MPDVFKAGFMISKRGILPCASICCSLEPTCESHSEAILHTIESRTTKVIGKISIRYRNALQCSADGVMIPDTEEVSVPVDRHRIHETNPPVIKPVV